MAAGCILLLYLGAYSPAGLAVAALGASFDPNHHLQLAASGRGLELVLHHDPNCPGHHHGAMARLLTFFAQPASAAHPDHVLQFSGANALLRQARIVLPAPAKLAQPVFVLMEMPVVFPLPAIPVPSANRPSLTDRGPLAALRSTVLLI